MNSSFTIRNLIIRGLVERIEHAKHAPAASTGSGLAVSTRGYLYRPTIECMKFLGITSFTELPEYAIFSEELSKGLTQSHDATQSQN